MPISLPDNILELKNEEFLNVVQQQCGKTMVEIFRYLEINSADYLLNTSTENLFAFFRHNSPNIAAIKSKVGIVLNDGNFVVKNGLFFQADTFIRALHVHRQQKDSLLSKDLTISSAHLNEHPVLRQIIRLFEHSYSEPNSLLDTFIYKIIDTITSNYFRAKNHYSYNDFIREFACCVYILGERNVYEFIRINIQGFLPSTTVIQRETDSKTTRMVEGEFRYDSMADHLASLETRFVFASEDCTAVVPKIVFDTKTNNFVGFTSSLEDGLPKVGSFSTESFSQLENWFDASNKSHYLNLQMIQPITKDEIHGSPFILSSYGTDNHFTTNDILMKWMNIFNNCKEKNTKLVGVSTDCDCRYMRSMRLFSGFFAKMPNQQIHMREDAFHLYIPKNWNWFFMRSRQLMLFFQDSIHLATKLRNRMLSSKATMLLGDEIISIDHLLQLIESSSKINHNLVRSDILPKDRQNYHSCEKISSKSVLDELVSIPNSAGTRLYLELIQNIRFAFVVKETNYLDRIYYAWKSVFLIRYWYSWLGSSSKNDLDAKLSKFSSEQNHQKKKTKQQFFITLPSMFSIEINCHTLVYLGLLVIQQQLPPECLNMSMFSSQNCENTFRLCRAMSGPFSSISRNQTNNSTIDFLFPHHHKLSKTIDTQQAASSSNSKQSLSLVTIEQNILRAYSDVSRLVVDVNIHSADQVFSLEKLSALAYQQLSKSRIIDYSCPDNYDSDFESDSDESCSDNDEDINLNETSQEEFFDEDQDISSENLMNIHTSTFEGMRVFDSIHPSLEKSYFVININGTKRYLNKQTATWLLVKEKVKLSADRLKRVMTVDE